MAERGKSNPDDAPADEWTVLLHYPLAYVTRTWLEHRQRGTYPESGAYNDQDAALMDDWYQLDMKMLDVERNLKEENGTAVEYPDTAKDWLSIT